MGTLRGKPVAVTFLYTRCVNSCPGQAQIVKGAFAELGHDVPALAISVDPPRDTSIGFPGSKATPEGLAHDLRTLERERPSPG